LSLYMERAFCEAVLADLQSALFNLGENFWGMYFTCRSNYATI
jgi:hypothetical protein